MAVPGCVQMDVGLFRPIPENACRVSFGDVDTGTAFGNDCPTLFGDSGNPEQESQKRTLSGQRVGAR